MTGKDGEWCVFRLAVYVDHTVRQIVPLSLFAPKFHCICCFFVAIWYFRKVLEIVWFRGYKWFVELCDPVYAYLGGVSPSERG